MAIPAITISDAYIKNPSLYKHKDGFLILLLYLDITPNVISRNTPYRQNIYILVIAPIFRQLFLPDWRFLGRGIDVK